MRKYLAKIYTMLMLVVVLAIGTTTAYGATASEARKNGEAGTKITLSQKYTGEIADGEGEVSNWYKIVTTNYNAKYCFTLKNIDIYTNSPGSYYGLYFTIYDADGAEVVTNHVTTAKEEVFWYSLDKNSVYYLELKSQYTGSYTFTVAPEQDDADDFDEATVISLGKEYFATIRTENGEDCFQIKTPNYAAVYSLYAKNIDIENFWENGLKYIIYDEDKQEKFSNSISYAEEETETFKLEPNKTYYVKFISAEYAGEYKFNLSAKKEEADTKASADTIKVGTTYSKKLELKDDLDWFKFKVSKTGYYKFYLKDVDVSGYNYDDLHMYIKKSSDKNLYDLTTYKGTSKSVDLKLTKGTYYICIDSPYEYSGNYKFKVSKYDSIGKTSISKLTATSKGFKIKWKKQTTGTTGYQIQYSTSKNFKNAKTITVSKNSTTSKTIKNLLAKKKYYVRIRTYKTYNLNGTKTKVYSAWSASKKVTTKK